MNFFKDLFSGYSVGKWLGTVETNKSIRERKTAEDKQAKALELATSQAQAQAVGAQKAIELNLERQKVSATVAAQEKKAATEALALQPDVALNDSGTVQANQERRRRRSSFYQPTNTITF